MGDYFSRNLSVYSFRKDESWAILSPVAREIKRKVEENGIPLSEWNIEINYGIKTGNNDVFIISGEVKDRILSNCQTEEERLRTAEIIRPILRGRDVAKYESNFADKWIIATFPSRKYCIDDYPALKEYLLSFGKERLEQSGETHLINGEKVKSRKKTNNRWFETQDSISYWDNFSRPKIVWKRVGSILRFCLDDKKMLSLDSTCIMVGEHLEFLVCLFNSKLALYLFQDAPLTGTGDSLISVQAVSPLKIPIPTPEQDKLFEILLKNRENIFKFEEQVNEELYKMFALSEEDIENIEKE